MRSSKAAQVPHSACGPLFSVESLTFPLSLWPVVGGGKGFKIHRHRTTSVAVVRRRQENHTHAAGGSMMIVWAHQEHP